MVEPSFLALTTTPSIGPSLAEVTSPESAAAACANAGAAVCNGNANKPAAASMTSVIRMRPSQFRARRL